MTRTNHMFSDRITDVPRSFIREILKVTLDPGVISFAGGLPKRQLFSVDGLKEATCKVFETQGKDVLQYANSETNGNEERTVVYAGSLMDRRAR